jgi:surface antigen
MHARHSWLLAAVPILLTACAETPQPRVIAAPLPAFGEGDSYTFDHGSVRSVQQIAGDDVFWPDEHQAQIVTKRDVLLPPEEEALGNLRLHRALPASDVLFPLRPGSHVTFTTRMQQESAAGMLPPREDAWSCTVGSATSAQTPAGSFDTLPVSCEADGGAVLRSFLYAPSIGYYVRRESRDPDGVPRVATLVSYTVGNPPLSDDALNRRLRGIERALEAQVSGTPVSWSDPGSGASGSVQPMFTVQSADDQWCREFQELIRTNGRNYDLLGTACRDPAGLWQVQQVTPAQLAGP